MRVVLRNEVPNFGRHIQQLQPLLFVQSYRKATHAIDGYSTLFAHLHSDAGCGTLFKRGVFISEPFKFGLWIFFGHEFSWRVTHSDWRAIPSIPAPSWVGLSFVSRG